MSDSKEGLTCSPLKTEFIPPELRNTPQWVMWKLENKTDQDKHTKVPYTVQNRKANATDAGTWNTFENCENALKTGLYNGLGFVFSLDDDYVGIDYDDVRNTETREIVPDILEEITSLNSYAEISQSGKGVHVFYKGKKPGNSCRRGCREMYEKDRFFAMTGNHLERTPLTVNTAPVEAIQAIYNKIAQPEKESKKNTQAVSTSLPLTDDEVISLCKRAQNAGKFEPLMDGTTSDYDGDDSAADLALCAIIAFYTQDPEQIDRIFRRSKLYREKWERADYRDRTIQKAIDGLTSTYQPYSNGVDTTKRGERFFGGKSGTSFQVKDISEDILKENQFASFKDTGEIYYYKNGVYLPRGEIVIKQAVQERLENKSRKNYQEEVINWIRNASYIEREEVIHPGKICVKNGVLDLTTIELSGHNPSTVFITQIPVEYKPLATCPVIEKFLFEVLDESDILAILDFFGYCLTPDTSIQKAFMLYGKGGEGKSTLLSLLTALIGKENVAGESLQKLETDRFAVANLYGKTVNVFPDLPDHAMNDSSMFKQLTGGDRLRGERKFGQPFHFKGTCKLIFSANSLPKAHNGDYAYFRRWVLIRFSKRVPPDEIDRNLINKLTTPEELSGLLNLAITGLKRLMEKGEYTYNKSTEEVEREYKIKSDPIIAFVEECILFSSTESISKSQMFDAYCTWCKKHGIEIMREQSLSRALTVMGYSDERETSGSRERYWKDCSLKKSVQLTQNELDDNKHNVEASPPNCPTQNDNFVEFSVQFMRDSSTSKQNREMSWRVGRIDKNQVQEPAYMSSNSNSTSWTDSKEEHHALEEEVIRLCDFWSSQNGPISYKNIERAIIEIGKNIKLPFSDLQILVRKCAEQSSFDNKHCIGCGNSSAPNKSTRLTGEVVYRCGECYHQYSNTPLLTVSGSMLYEENNNSVYCGTV